MWLGKSKVKMKTVTNRVLNILRFLFTVNAELLISKLSSVLDWFINIYYILTSDEDVLRSNISSVIESCWNWKVPYVDYIHKTMYDDTSSLSPCMYADTFSLYICWYFNIINWNLNTMWYVTLACRFMYIQHFMAILHYLYWYFITICWYFSVYAD